MRRIVILIALSLLAVGCAPSAPATMNPQEVANLAAMTVAVLSAQTAQASVMEVQTATPVQPETVQMVTDTPIPQPTNNSPLDMSDEEFNAYCRPVLEEKLRAGEITSINRLNSQLKVGDAVIIKSPVQLRTTPGLSEDIVVTLNPGNQATVIGGPKVTTYHIGSKYIWWNIRLSDEIFGWSVEMSACRQEYFMEPVR